MWFYYSFVVLSCLVFANGGKTFKGKPLPNYVIPCSKSSPDLNECAKINGRKAIPSFINGDKAYKVPVLSPLKLDRLEIKPGSNLELILTRVSVYGLENLQLKDINIVEGKRHVDLELAGDGVRIMSDYKVSGQILILPIAGEGKADFKFDELSFKYSLDYDLSIKSDGKDYAVIRNTSVAFKCNKAKFYMENLFNGNKELGDNMNKVLNENYDKVLEDLGGAISSVIETVASSVLRAVMNVVPYDEILLP